MRAMFGCLSIALSLMLSSAMSQPQEQPNDQKAHVFVTNSKFPLKVEWQVDGGAEKGEFIGSGYVPAGQMIVAVKPVFNQAWYQWGIWMDEVSGQVIPDGNGKNAMILDLRPGSEIRIYALPPSAPWNGTFVSVSKDKKKCPLYVSVRTTGVGEGIKEFEAGTLQDGKEFPNTPLFWAKYGTEGLAEELANHFVASRDGDEHRGYIEGTYRTAIIVPYWEKRAKQERIPEPLMTVTAAELKPVLVEAFEEILTHTSRNNRSMKDQVEKAQVMLKEGRPRKPN